MNDEERQIIQEFPILILALAYYGKWIDEGTFNITLSDENGMAFCNAALALLPLAEKHSKDYDTVMQIKRNLKR